MKKRRALLFSLATLLGLIGVLMINFIIPCSAETPIQLLAASATSSSEDSSPVVNLLDPGKEGFWKPKGQDEGANEGLYFRFQEPVLIDRIEVKVKNGKDNYWISYYLDGKKNIPTDNNDDALEEDYAEDYETGEERVEYAIDRKNTGKDCLFLLGTRKWDPEAEEIYLAPLNVEVQSVFIKIEHAGPNTGVTSIRFFRDQQKKPLPVQIPLFEKGAINATSTLEPKTAYHIINLFDSRLEFAWATDGKKSDGIGENFTITLNRPQSLSGLMIWNGYQRSDTHYFANSRPKEIKIKINDQEKWSLNVADQMAEQTILFPESVDQVNKVSVEISAIFPGTKYKDLVVSEFRLIDKTGNIIILNTPIPNIPVSNPNLKKILDLTLEPCLQMLQSVKQPFLEDEAPHYPYNSIRFRSNGSFVCYTGFGDGQIMEGNWEPIANGVRIFGKKYHTYYSSTIYLPEEGDPEEDVVSIFQANIEILDPAKLSESQLLKYFKPVLAERGFYDLISKRKPPFDWRVGIDPFGKVKVTGVNEADLIKKAAALAISKKAILLSSPLFTDIFLPRDQVQQEYPFEP